MFAVKHLNRCHAYFVYSIHEAIFFFPTVLNQPKTAATKAKYCTRVLAHR